MYHNVRIMRDSRAVPHLRCLSAEKTGERPVCPHIPGKT